MLSRGSKKQLVVAIATRHPGALAALESAPVERREAVTTGGLYRALPGVHLAIVDLEALTESSECSRERLAQVLGNSNVLVVDGVTFASDPSGWLARAGAVSGIAEALPSASIAFASLSGGVGKTTLSLSLARYFRKRTGLPAAVVEVSAGPSALLALLSTNGRGAHIYEVVTQSKPWPRNGDGVTLAPMDWRFAQMLETEEIEAAWRSLIGSHTLTIFDAPAYHNLYPIVERLARVVIVTDTRLDALANAIFLAGQEREILINRGGLTARLALDRPPVAVIPHVDNAGSYPVSIGRRLMPVVYPGWKGR